MKRKPGATSAGVLVAGLVSALLLCGAGLTPTGNVQTADINANGHSLTNAVTVSAANVSATNSLTVPANFFATNQVVQTTGSYTNPPWLSAVAWSKISGTPTTLSGYGITDGGGYAPHEKKTANFTAAVGHVYGVDTTSGSVTCTPPASPADGDWFVLFDVAKKWGTHAAVIGSSANSFVDTAHPSSATGPYNLDAVPFIGQGMIRFVWVASASTWSVN